jgi:uncharacterized FlgJ-related protein
MERKHGGILKIIDMKKYEKIIIWFMSICTIFYFTFIINQEQQRSKMMSEINFNDTLLKVDTVNICTLDDVFNFLKSCNLEHPEIVFAQIRLESGNLESRLSRENNNILGMKHPRQRPTTSLGERLGFASYTSWKECIFDYMIWQSRYAKKLSKNEYFQLLDKVYAEDGSYEKKLRNILKNGN